MNKFLIKYIYPNWKAKIGSIFVAILLYINLQSSKILEKYVNIPIEYPEISADLSYGKNSDKTLPVKVEGDRKYVNYYIRFLKAHIDKKDLKPGKNIVEIVRISGIPNGIKVKRLKSNVKIYIEESSPKSVSLDVAFENNLPKNYIRTSYFINPRKVTLFGNKSKLDKINKLQVGTISLKDRIESFETKLKIENIPKGIQLKSQIKEVVVRVNIVKASSTVGERIIVGVPVKCNYQDTNLLYEYSHEEVAVELMSENFSGTEEIMESLTASVVCVQKFDQNTNKIIPDDKPVKLKVNVKKDNKITKLKILSVEPQEIEVSFKIKKVKEVNEEEESTETENQEENSESSVDLEQFD